MSEDLPFASLFDSTFERVEGMAEINDVSSGQLRDLEDALYTGFMDFNADYFERSAARDEFAEIMAEIQGVDISEYDDPSDALGLEVFFDWEAWREEYDAA